MIVNTTVMSLFGISLIDIYGFDLLSFFRDTSIYAWFSGLLSTPKISKPPHRTARDESIPSWMRETNKNAPKGTGNENGSGMIERIKQRIHKEPEVIEDNSSNTKYYIIGALFIISCLTWYYYGDDISLVIGNGIDKIKSSFRRKPGNDGTINPTNIDNDLQNNSSTNTLWNIWDKVKSKFRKNNQTPLDSLTPNTPAQIELLNKSTKFNNVESPQLLASSSKLSPIQEVSEKSTPSTGWIGENAMDQFFSKDDKGKSIDITNLTESEITRRVIEHSTGQSAHKFEIESEDILSKMAHFVATHESDTFPNLDIKKAISSLLSTQMTVLYLNYKKYYLDWVIKPDIKEIFDKFKVIEKEIESSNVNEPQPSNTYEELANSAVQEQEAWSDGPNSSLHSPYANEEIFECPPDPPEGEGREMETQQSMLGPFINELNKLPDQPNIIEQVEAEVKAEATTEAVPVPVGGDKPKPIFSDLWNQIKSRRNDSNVIDDTNKEPIISSDSSETDSSKSTGELEHYLPESQQSNIETKAPEKPEIKIDSPKELEHTTEQSIENRPLSSILDTVKGLLTPKTETKPLETNVEGSSQDVEPSPPGSSRFINLFESIKARRDDSNVISTPKVAQVGLQTPIHERLDVTPTWKEGSPFLLGVKQPSPPGISNLLEDTNALFDLDDDDDTDLNPIVEESSNNLSSPLDINWNNIAPRIVDGIKTEINFKDIWRVTDTIIITTNKNHDIRYKFDETNLGSLGPKIISFDLKDKVPHINDNFPDLQIKEIFIEDTSHDKHSIFKL